jgi:uncharacterized lipoprotein YmbA
LRTQYLLRAETPAHTKRIEAPARIGLGRITVASYLDQSGIVIETEEREVRAARNHQWAEPLADGLRIYLRDEIANALGEEVGIDPSDRTSWDYVVDVFVEQLHGTVAGRAVLVASFRIEAQAKSSGKGVEQRFAQSKALDREGYGGLVDAEVALLRQLTEAIAADVREISNKGAAVP